jgi:hypothetical protein
VPRVDHAITHTRPLQWRTATGTQIGSHGRKKSEREGGLPEIETAVVAAPVRLQERRRPDVGAARRDPSSPAAKMLRPSRRQDAPPLPQRLRSPPVARRRSLASGRSPPVARSLQLLVGFGQERGRDETGVGDGDGRGFFLAQNSGLVRCQCFCVFREVF